ncbi:MAG: 23S rRNA (adenine(1618)-N(6))-methyltransferase RlmF [Ekhidna sp.]
MQEKKTKKKAQSKIHPRNKHQGRYDLNALIETTPELSSFVVPNKYGDQSIDFANPDAVKTLNKALLKHHYNISDWDIPEGYLVPPIPGRADYIHHIADVLCASNFGRMLEGEKIKVLDIGTGSNCIYPFIGHREYGWSFIASDIDSKAIEAAEKIIKSNTLDNCIELRLQSDPKDIFYGVIRMEEHIDLTICNPPFHSSAEAAQKGTLRKLNNLNKEKVTEPVLNFGGKNGELWCEGGENQFIKTMIRESRKFGKSCIWFSTLVSKQSNVKGVQDALRNEKAKDIKVIPMGQGNKSSRIVAWTFLTREEQAQKRDSRKESKDESN